MCGFGFAIGTPRELLYLFANLFLRGTQFVKLLKVEPKIRTGPKPVAKSERGVGKRRRAGRL
jgi:hypothetical protein